MTKQDFMEYIQNHFEAQLIKLSQMVEAGRISSTGAKKVFKELATRKRNNIRSINLIFQGENAKA